MIQNIKIQYNIGRISLFWSMELQGHTEKLNGGDHDILVQQMALQLER